MPERKPDYYYTEVPRKDHRVTFITDIDSISFDVSFGNTYDFIILWNEKDTCYTRISASYRNILSYSKTNAAHGPDTIPFFMNNSRIFFEGSINQNSGMIFQFDLGAGMSNISHKSVEKARITFDGKTNLINTHGTNEAPTSSSNTIEIAGLVWENVPFVQTQNMDKYEDAIIGNSLVEGKVVEINYDLMMMILHDTLPPFREGYSKHEVIYSEHRPHIKAAIVVDGKPYTDWFLFDTGRKGTGVIGDSFFRKNNVWDKLKTVRTSGDKHIAVIPQLMIGECRFTNVIAPAWNPEGINAGRSNILGNELLNHFNVFLDNQNGIIYLKPNSLQNNKYKNLNSVKWKAVITLFALVATIAAIIVFKLSFRTKKE
jgi:hypothetical protein